MWRRFRSRTRVVYRRGRSFASGKKMRKAYLVGAIAFIFLFFMAPNFRRFIEDTFTKWFPNLKA